MSRGGATPARPTSSVIAGVASAAAHRCWAGDAAAQEFKRLLANKPVITNPVHRAVNAVLDVCNSTTVQTLMYCLFVLVFQARP